MPTEKTVASLLRMPLFYGLSPQQITEISRHAEKRRYRPGDVICRKGEAADAAIILVSGSAEREPDTLEEKPEPVEPGSIISELAMIVEREHGSTVTAREVVLCLKVTRAGLHAQMVADPSMAERLEQRMVSRLQRLAEKLRRIENLLADPGAVTSAIAQSSMGPGHGSAAPNLFHG